MPPGCGWRSAKRSIGLSGYSVASARIRCSSIRFDPGGADQPNAPRERWADLLHRSKGRNVHDHGQRPEELQRMLMLSQMAQAGACALLAGLSVSALAATHREVMFSRYMRTQFCIERAVG